jgi:hypothetical protein
VAPGPCSQPSNCAPCRKHDMLSCRPHARCLAKWSSGKTMPASHMAYAQERCKTCSTLCWRLPTADEQAPVINSRGDASRPQTDRARGLDPRHPNPSACHARLKCCWGGSAPVGLVPRRQTGRHDTGRVLDPREVRHPQATVDDLDPDGARLKTVAHPPVITHRAFRLVIQTHVDSCAARVATTCPEISSRHGLLADRVHGRSCWPRC